MMNDVVVLAVVEQPRVYVQRLIDAGNVSLETELNLEHVGRREVQRLLLCASSP